MQGYIDKALQGKNIGRTAATTAKDGLFDIDPEGIPLAKIDKKAFHSDIARMLPIPGKENAFGHFDCEFLIG